MAKYTIGLDYGTLSARAVLVDVKTGEEIGSATYEYPHAVMDRCLPSGKKLELDWALQHPDDYIEALGVIIPSLLKETKVSPTDIIGIGSDFTACTILPVLKDGTPLCKVKGYEDEPHAYPKLWKHHAAQYKATIMNEVAKERNEEWFPIFGSSISSEWEIPKLWQILEEAPHIYEAMDLFVAGGDWLTWQLTDVFTRNCSAAGYKGLWNKKLGFPPKEYFKALDPRLENVIGTKIPDVITPVGNRAGGLSKRMAALTGLLEGTPVAVGTVDAHVTIPAAKICEPGKMLGIIGTSTCHILLSDEEIKVPGISAIVEGGVVPGYFGYEAGQSCVGEHFAWVVDHCTPPSYFEEAKAVGLNIHQYLTAKASELEPGESGLVALDWWNGNRCVLDDGDLSGVILGLNLFTRAEDIYRTLIEATAFGTKKIIEDCKAYGVKVDEFYAAGGISKKNALAMQIYSDVLNMPVKIAASSQAPALGSAIFGAVAAGAENGGYDDMRSATLAMGNIQDYVYTPNPEAVDIYNELYKEYILLHDYFGRGVNNGMKRLRARRKAILHKKSLL